ncbi:hypothetical protein BH18ACT10_BH18ACT10_08510 [soil metagenome]
MDPDDTGVLPKLIKKFNKQNKGKFQVVYRQMSSYTGQYFDQLRTQFQAGGGDIQQVAA